MDDHADSNGEKLIIKEFSSVSPAQDKPVWEFIPFTPEPEA
jgi:hypothetical protein